MVSLGARVDGYRPVATEMDHVGCPSKLTMHILEGQPTLVPGQQGVTQQPEAHNRIGSAWWSHQALALGYPTLIEPSGVGKCKSVVRVHEGLRILKGYVVNCDGRRR